MRAAPKARMIKERTMTESTRKGTLRIIALMLVISIGFLVAKAAAQPDQDSKWRPSTNT